VISESSTAISCKPFEYKDKFVKKITVPQDPLKQREDQQVVADTKFSKTGTTEGTTVLVRTYSSSKDLVHYYKSINITDLQ